MKTENQVVSIELAQKLKELGVKQESLFWWDREYYDPLPPTRVTAVRYHLLYGTKPLKSEIEDGVFTSAFTVAELGELLPPCTWSSGVVSTNGDYNCWRFKEGGGVTEKESFYAETEADARAKMLIYLIENKIRTV